MTGAEQAALNVQLGSGLAAAALQAAGGIAGEARIFNSLSSFVGAAGSNVAQYQLMTAQNRPAVTQTQATSTPKTATTSEPPKNEGIGGMLKKFGVWIAAGLILGTVLIVWKPWK
jgi:hypothetical protein